MYLYFILACRLVGGAVKGKGLQPFSSFRLTIVGSAAMNWPTLTMSPSEAAIQIFGEGIWVVQWEALGNLVWWGFFFWLSLVPQSSG